MIHGNCKSLRHRHRFAARAGRQCGEDAVGGVIQKTDGAIGEEEVGLMESRALFWLFRGQPIACSMTYVQHVDGLIIDHEQYAINV